MIYTIKKGSHYTSGFSVGGLHTGKYQQQNIVKFDRSCLLLPGKTDCNGDWNKLFGFSYGYHHSDSIRLVWKSQSGMIRIGWYVYEGGIRTYKGFSNINVEDSVLMNIDYDEANKIIYFTCGNKIATAPFSKPVGWGYNLLPYYGGNCTAPQTMNITLI